MSNVGPVPIPSMAHPDPAGRTGTRAVVREPGRGEM